MSHEVADKLKHHGRTDEDEEETYDQHKRHRRSTEYRVPAAAVAAGVVRCEASLTAVDGDEKAHVAEG